MEYLNDLKDMLCEELEHITEGGELNAGNLDAVQKLTHSLKSVETIMAMEGHSNDGYYANTSRRAYSRRGSYNGGYARRGSYRRGRSMDNESMKMIEKLERMAEQTEDPASKQAIQQAIESLDM